MKPVSFVPQYLFQSVNNAIGIEASTPDKAAEEQVAERMCRDLAKVALYTPDQLSDVYMNAKNESRLRFFERIEIATVSGTYLDDVIVVDEQTLLRKLESIPSQPPFTDLRLGAELQERLGFKAEERLHVEAWSYENMSKELPERGLHNGRYRRLYFGVLLRELSPPIEDGKWAIFEGLRT